MVPIRVVISIFLEFEMKVLIFSFSHCSHFYHLIHQGSWIGRGSLSFFFYSFLTVLLEVYLMSFIRFYTSLVYLRLSSFVGEFLPSFQHVVKMKGNWWVMRVQDGWSGPRWGGSIRFRTSTVNHEGHTLRPGTETSLVSVGIRVFWQKERKRDWPLTDFFTTFLVWIQGELSPERVPSFRRSVFYK